MHVSDVPSVPLAKYRGQERLVKLLLDEVAASKIRGRALPNMVFAGPPGLGKNTLIYSLADARDVDIVKMQGPQVKEESLATALADTNRDGHDARGFVVDRKKLKPTIWWFDEAENIPTAIFEILHDILQAREDGRRIFHVKAPRRAQRQAAWCPEITVIFTTNYLGVLRKRADAAVNRCGIKWVFEPYTDEDLIHILLGSAKKDGYEVHPDAAKAIAERSLGIPRTAILLLERCINKMVAKSAGAKKLTVPTVDEALELLGIDDLGLAPLHRNYLTALGREAAGKMGLDSLAATIGSDKQTIAQDVEPFLMRLGLVTIVAGGRQITEKGLSHIGSENANPLHTFILSNEDGK